MLCLSWPVPFGVLGSFGNVMLQSTNDRSVSACIPPWCGRQKNRLTAGVILGRSVQITLLMMSMARRVGTGPLVNRAARLIEIALFGRQVLPLAVTVMLTRGVTIPTLVPRKSHRLFPAHRIENARPGVKPLPIVTCVWHRALSSPLTPS